MSFHFKTNQTQYVFKNYQNQTGIITKPKSPSVITKLVSLNQSKHDFIEKGF